MYTSAVTEVLSLSTNSEALNINYNILDLCIGSSVFAKLLSRLFLHLVSSDDRGD